MSQNSSVTVHVPATSANLGPGFDCLGLTLNLWNQATFTLCGTGIHVKVHGMGSQSLPKNGRNLIARSALKLYALMGMTAPDGLFIECHNQIPLDSGLGSSAAACLTGLLGANVLLGCPMGADDLLKLGNDIEGHPDNVAAAIMGSLVMVSDVEGRPMARRIDIPEIEVAVAVPQIHLPTHAARSVLPREVPLKDAVFNTSRALLVVEALRSGDFQLLGKVMEDRLHQPFRFKMIPGAVEAEVAALKAGAFSVALSGAGPSLVAFHSPHDEVETICIAEAMVQAFGDLGVKADGLALKVSSSGASVEP